MNTEDVVKFAEARGAEQAEAAISEERLTTIYLQGKNVKAKFEERRGVGLRLVKKNRIGFSYSTRLDGKNIEEVIKHALKFTDISNPYPKAINLPAYDSSLKCSKCLDKRLALSNPDQILRDIHELVNYSDFHDYAEIIGGNIWISFRKFYVSNSFGLTCERFGTYGSITIVTTKKGNDLFSGFAKKAFINYRDFERALIEVPREAFERVKEGLTLKGENLHGNKKSTVILESYLSPYLLRETLIETLRADKVKDSFYGDKMSEQVATNIVTILDDGTLDGGYATSCFDDEGVPTRKKFLINKGMLANYLYDTVNACLNLTDNAGNGIRYSNIFNSEPIPGPTNVIFQGEKEMSKEELIESVQEGFIIRHAVGIETMDTEGYFLLPAIGAFRIENGEKKARIKNLSFCCLVPELLMKITGVGDDRVMQDYSDGREGLIFPSIRVDDVYVVAQ